MTVAPKQKNSKPINYKAIDMADAKVDASSRTISGYAAIWGNRDDAGDVLVKGCFAKSIAERGPDSSTNRKIIFLWMHDCDEPLGKITVLREDDKGLYFEAVVDKIPEGDRAIEQLKSGTLNQFSFGFCYVWDKCEYDAATDSFICKELNLFEISVVSLGCNEETGFEGMKNLDIISEGNKLIRETEKALKGLPYEDQIKIKQLISKHIALATLQPVKPTGKDDEPQAKGVDFGTLINALKK